MFGGYCDGAQEAKERHGVEVRLTPDITRSAPLEDAHTLVEVASRYRDRGIVAVGLGGEGGVLRRSPSSRRSGPRERPASDRSRMQAR